jgi:endonuclease/exonuclease/phosphatase family metal-dependent hydrolase
LRHLIVASWNIHSGVGADRRYRPDRVRRVIHDLGADVLGLQEVDTGYRLSAEDHQIVDLAEAFDGYSVTGPTLWHEQYTYGNLLLSRWPVRDVERLDLSVSGREPRGAIRAIVEPPGGPLAVHVFHLGLRRSERVVQARRLLEAFGPEQDLPAVWMGDANEWWPRAEPLRLLTARLGDTGRVRTFPAVLPLLRLDRIWVRPGDPRDRVHAHRRPPAPWSSDHLPLVARLEWPRRSLPAGDRVDRVD